MDNANTEKGSGSPVENESTYARVRRRPGMYIGDIEAQGLHRLYECSLIFLLYAARPWPDITVRFHADGSMALVGIGDYYTEDSRVTDTESLMKAVIEDFTSHAAWDTGPAQLARGPLPTMALSSSSQVILSYGGAQYRFRFIQGQLTGAPEVVCEVGKGSLSIIFTPDTAIFGNNNLLQASVIRAHLHQMAYLHQGTRFRFEDADTGDQITHVSYDGIAEYLNVLTFDKHPRHPVLHGHIEVDGMAADLAVQYCMPEETTIVTFVNNERIYGGGVQEHGLLSGLARAMSRHIRSAGQVGQNWNDVMPDEMCKGLTAVIALWLPQPVFGHTWRGEVRGVAVEEMVERLAADLLSECPIDRYTIDYRYLFETFERGRRQQ